MGSGFGGRPQSMGTPSRAPRTPRARSSSRLTASQAVWSGAVYLAGSAINQKVGRVPRTIIVATGVVQIHL